MGYWYSATSGYNEGDPIAFDSVSVPRRPDATYVWNGSTWAPTAATAEAQAQTLFNAAIENGITLTSTASPSLNGVYAIGPYDTANISDEAQYIAQYGNFTSGGPSMAWADANGTLHTFASTPQFMTFAKAVAQYVSALKITLLTLRAGASAPWPSNQVTIP